MKLSKILNFAIKKNACSGNLNAFKKFIEQGKEVEAWQVVLGNHKWLIDKGLLLTKDVEKNANNIGTNWYANGKLFVKCNYKNGKIEGLIKVCMTMENYL